MRESIYNKDKYYKSVKSQIQFIKLLNFPFIVGFPMYIFHKFWLKIKTQSNKNANAYNTDEQLGAYASMLISLGVWIDECRTIWCRPDRTVVGEYQDVSTCLEAWNSKLGFWKMMQEEF